MMDGLFLSILRMHKTAAVVILAVLIVRLLLRKAPKKWSYGLWSVVGFRLVCPVSFSSSISLFNLSPQVLQAPQPGGPYEMTGPVQVYPTPDIPMSVFSYSEEAHVPIRAAAVDPLELWIRLGTIVWLMGLLAILVYGIISYVKLKRTLNTAVRLDGRVWQSDQICTPFILGFLRPKIYLPFGLEPDVQRIVLAHERFHLKHLDHWVKPFSFLLLAVHWFDPLVWLAFQLMGKDMEMRTDEAVLSTEANIRKAYSASLLSFAVKHKFPAPSPLAFGESGVKSRIKNVLNWQAPKLWLSIFSIILCTLVILACAANEKNSEEDEKIWALPPTVEIGDYQYRSAAGPEQTLPPGYTAAGVITKEQAGTSSILGRPYYTNPNIPDLIFVYQECGTPISDDTIDTNLRQMAYVGWTLVDSRFREIGYYEAHRDLIYSGEYKTKAESLREQIFDTNQDQWAIKPHLLYKGMTFYETDDHLGSLPAGYYSMGTVTSEMSQHESMTGFEFFVNSPEPSTIYVYAPANRNGESENTSYRQWLYYTYSNESFSAMFSPICTVQVGDIISSARYYPDGFDFDYDGWYGSTPEIQDSYTITFTPSWDCETLTVGEDYYTRSGFIRRSTYELSPNAEGSFTLEVQPADPNYGEHAWYFIPYGEMGKFVERVNFQRTDPWGLYTSVHDVTTTSATLSFNRKNAAEHGQLLTGKAFWIERQEGDFWVPVDSQADQSTVWTGQAYDIPERGTIWKTDWAGLYGELPPGTYRICKTVQRIDTKGFTDEETYYGIFLIMEDTISKDHAIQAAIRDAILTYYGPPQSETAFSCESHVLLGHAVEDIYAVVDETKYADGKYYFYFMVLYQEYEAENGTPKLIRSNHEPLGISLETYTDGTCIVLRCWNDDGSTRYEELAGLFPEDKPDPNVLLPQQEADCLSQAEAFFTS